jgi:transcriptional regulator NrdR family protein
MKDGGTKMYCPACDTIQVCRAIPTTSLGEASGQRWFSPEHDDLNWFRRGRECLECGETFITAEIRENFLDELMELRKALGKIKLNAEQYMKESAAASESLAKLSESLEVLRALNLYKQEAIDIAALSDEAEEEDDEE